MARSEPLGVGEGSGEVSVLHVDDDEAFVDATAAQLEREHAALSVTTAVSPEHALEVLAESHVDCVVSDYQMPEMDGLAFLEAVREVDPDVPFILFTGKGNEEIAGDAVSAGVTDYLQKGTGTDQFTVLANRIENVVAQQRAAAEAAAKDRRMREVHERVSDAVVAIDEDWRYTYANDRALELLDRDEPELIGERLWDAFPGLRDSPFEEPLREAMATREATAGEGYFEPLDVWFEIRVYPDETGLSVYFRDVSERRRRERRYEAIFNGSYQFTGLMEPDGTLIEANDTALRFGGIDRDDVVGKKVWNTYWFQHGDAAEVAREAVERAREGEFVRHELDVQGDDRIATIDFSVRPITDDRGEVDLLIPEGRDVTELTERERRYEAIFNGSYQFTGLMEPDGTLIEANDTALRFGGIDRDDVVGKKVWNTYWFQHGDAAEVAREAVERAREGEFVRHELEVRGDEGTTVIDFSVRPVTDEDGDVTLLVPEGREISDLKEREAELRRQNERLEEFASVVSHDLKNPLTVAVGHLELAREDLDHEALDSVEAALERMAGMIEDLLDLAEQGRIVSDTEPVDLATVVDRVVEELPGDVDATVERRLGDECVVEADRERLQVLVENLLDNAREHGGDGVRIEVGCDGDGFHVADDGPGLPADDGAVFEPGYTTDQDGNGFGLSIVRSIARAHGWTVEAGESEAGGARFDVRFEPSP